MSEFLCTFAPYFVTQPSKYTRITYVQYTYYTRRIYVLLCFRYANKLTPLAWLRGHPSGRKPKPMLFADRRAGASEYLLLKRDFSTCTRIATREWLKLSHPLPLTISVANSVAKTASSCVPVTAKRTLTRSRTRTPDPPPKRRTPCAPRSVWRSSKPQPSSKIPSRKPIGSADMPPTASTIAPPLLPVTTPPSAASSSPPSTPN